MRAILLAAISALLCAGPAISSHGQSVNGSQAIDRAMRSTWQKAGVEPSSRIDDARFLRRIYLDIIGTIPTPQIVSDFISDTSRNKRAQAVEALLSDPRYADHWTTYWDGILMGKQAFSPVVDRNEFRQWLHSEMANNTPWNQFVTKLITATGQNSTGPTYAEANAPGMMSKPMDADADNAQPVDRSRINGAVNWQLKFAQTPADLSGTASRVFLGVQIQCAQCHDHKTEKWKQTDFKSFTACFTQAVPQPAGGFAQMLQMKQNGAPKVQMNKVREVNLVDIAFAVRPNQLNGGQDRAIYQQVTPAALDGTSFAGAPAARRRNLAAWMTSDNNEWFAKAYVNRIWARFLGRGFVEPIDDFRPSNPAVIPEALDALAEQFKASGYDTRQLIKTICATEVYQLSAAPAAKTDQDNSLFARYRLKPMETDALLNALVAATNFQTVLGRMPGGNLEQIKARLQRQLTFVFTTDEEEMEPKEFEGTIPQALLLLNGNLTNNGVMPIPGTALAEVMTLPNDTEKIESLYLRALSRMPTSEESKRWEQFVNAEREVAITAPPAQQNLQRPGPNNGQPGQKAAANNGQPGQPPRQPGAGGAPTPGSRIAKRVGSGRQSPKLQAYEDMFWALLNSSEFAFNH